MNDLVKFAYQSRDSEPYESMHIDRVLLDSLPALYEKCIKAYSEVMKSVDTTIAAKLERLLN